MFYVQFLNKGSISGKCVRVSMQAAKPSPTLPYHLNPKVSHCWETATAVHYVDACGRTCTHEVNPAPALTLLEKFSGKDYTDLMCYICDSIPNTEKRPFACQEPLWPGELQQSMAHTKNLWAHQESSCHQTSAKGCSALANYRITSS